MMERVFGKGSRLRILETEGDPPERHRLEYLVPGLVVQKGAVTHVDRHLVEVYLTLAYPRQAPQCRMLTTIFHPNIAPHAICIGDHWSAGESLPALLIRIAEMITYQSYNLKSPLNGDAARWTDEHVAELPLESFDFGSLLAIKGSDADGPGVLAAPAAGFDSPAPPESLGAPPAAPKSIGGPPAPPESIGGPPAAPAAPRGGIVEGIRSPEPILAPAAGVAPPRPEHAPGRADSRCSSCGAALSVPRDYAGEWARCPLCGRLLRIEPRS